MRRESLLPSPTNLYSPVSGSLTRRPESMPFLIRKFIIPLRVTGRESVDISMVDLNWEASVSSVPPEESGPASTPGAAAAARR